MSKWDDITNGMVDQHGVMCRLVRLADPDVPASADIDVTIRVAALQFRERDRESGGDLTQQTRYYLIPAVRLQAAGFPVPPRPGDRMIFPDLQEVATIKNVGPGFAENALVRYDVEVMGI
jgi:hypothetical protein